MIALRFAFELLILSVASVGPGLFLLGRWRRPSLEKLCLAIGLSWLVIYLAATGIYLGDLNGRWYLAVFGLCAVATAWRWRGLRGLWEHKQVRRAVAGFGLLLLWNLLMLSLVRSYSGGDWFGDWFEHYQRSVFFLDHLPKETKFLGVYDLPARPPMMNLLCGGILAAVGKSYDVFGPAAVFLNLLVFFPCALISSALVRRGRRLGLLTVFFAASPLIVQNATFMWTKLFAAFYVILGTWLYLRGWQKQEPWRIIAALAALASGFIAHYSVGPYLLFFALHYAVVLRSRRRPWTELLGSAAAGALILASWFLWAVWRYGWKITTSSNTAVADARKLSALGNLRKIGWNIFTTLAPHPLHVPLRRFELDFWQPSSLGWLRDYWFMIYQTTLLAGMGLVGGLLVLWLLWRSLRPGAGGRGRRLFWGSFVGFCAIAGIAAHGAATQWGVAHICLQPLMVLGVTLLAASFGTMPTWMRRVAAAGLVADFCLGIFLHIHVQRTLMPLEQIGSTRLIALSDQLLSTGAIENDIVRIGSQAVLWGDHFAGVQTPLQAVIILLFAAALYRVSRAGSGTKPDRYFYFLLALLAVGIIFCGRDQFRQSEAASDEQLRDPAPYAAAVRNDPDSSAARLALGEALYRNGQLEQATDSFLEAAILNVPNDPARYDLLLCIAQSGHREAAVLGSLVAADEVAGDPDSAAGHVKLGAVLVQKRHLGPAQDQAARALQLSPDSADAHYLMGAVCFRLGGREHLDQAIEHFSEALRLRPSFAEAAQALRASRAAREAGRTH